MHFLKRFQILQKKSMKPLPHTVITVLSFLLLATFSGIAQKGVTGKAAVNSTLKPVFRNGIKITSNGFKVSDAFLYFDDGKRVPANNRVAVNQRINMRVVIDSGWTEHEGKVYPGASEVIKMSGGQEVIRADDLFESFDETGVSAEDAQYITLKAIITKISDKKQYAIVTFKIWDKKGGSELTGSYKFFLK